MARQKSNPTAAKPLFSKVLMNQINKLSVLELLQLKDKLNEIIAEKTPKEIESLEAALEQLKKLKG
ncbi:MAG TPA: hypothetical protein PLG47_06310 [Candidatus Dojkabacteria bacterium]|nr:hypothetical protein [Candidatus Dojkabacteria bacterium]